MNNLHNTHIISQKKLSTPEHIKNEFPLSEKAKQFIVHSRETVGNIVKGKDTRIIAIPGPCSIHDPKSALEIAEKIKALQEILPHLFLVMRVYFEKPRTTIGWKGLINDPHLNGTFDIETGLRTARKLLVDLAEMGVPAAGEFLDPLSPQYVADCFSWAAIGARTTESQIHREMTSGLSMPTGMKNGTNGGIQIALDGIKSTIQGHHFLGIDEQGDIAHMHTTGKDDTHIILRGGSNGPNYSKCDIAHTQESLEKAGIETGIIVDVSHANSGKNHENQPLVCSDVAQQIADGNKKIVGVMIESHIKAGNQSHTAGKDDSSKLVYGQSITDKCVDWNTNVLMLEELDGASKKRAQI
ncbi:3-deoxy-7-phosphoheptulonate synthase [Candidatus Gracilibacteria bacterium]|nr:3-deoxy-7-phosphoheptulonate synthase [Candidatus Gracilibacteria bacterium]